MLIAAAVVMAAVCANASYLYWQVSGTETGLSNGTLNGHTISGYNLVAIDASGNKTTTSSYVYSSTTDGYVTVSPVSTTAAAYGAYADLSSSYSEGYTYYIEVTGYDSAKYGENTGVIGQSNTFSYSDLAGHMTAELSSMAASVQALVGTAYGAPEPTSGLLLLVGTALLALRRRRA